MFHEKPTRFRCHINIPPSRVLEKIRSSTRPVRHFYLTLWDFGGEELVSKIEGDKFLIRKRYLRHRSGWFYFSNSFSPIVSGSIRSENGGTTLEATLQFHPVIRMFTKGLLLFTALCLVLGIGMIVSGTSDRTTEVLMLLFAAGFLILFELVGQFAGAIASEDQRQLISFLDSIGRTDS